MRIKYRMVRKAYKTVKYGPTLGSSQYLARQVWHMDKSKPGGNYRNPKRAR